MLKNFDKFPKIFGRNVNYGLYTMLVKGEMTMSLGDKILDLRKKNGLSQEQLGEKIDVTRQTISNWELGETQPNPEQLKLLSEALKVSIDDLLDNNIQNVVVEKVSNTEKLAGMAINATEKLSGATKKTAKILGIAFAGLLIIDIISFIIFLIVK